MERVTSRVKKLLRTKDRVVVAISGFGGSGKTTFAKKIHEQFPASTIINMDDFVTNRGVGRGWQGGFDWDRFSKLLRDIRDGRDLHYQRYDWKSDALDQRWIRVQPTPLVIIEGVRIFQPRFMPYFDLTVWLDVDLETATARGINRDRQKWHRIDSEGLEKHLESWHTVWKPKEVEFLNLFHPDEEADLKITP